MDEPRPVWYVACLDCTAKFFADSIPTCCPRCGAEQLLVDRQTQPWRRANVRTATPQGCDHTLHAIADTGEPTGSWTIDRSKTRPRVVCGVCGKFYGYLRAPKKRRGRGARGDE